MANLDQKAKLAKLLKKIGGASEFDTSVYNGVLNEIAQIKKNIPEIPDLKPLHSELNLLAQKIGSHSQLLSTLPEKIEELKSSLKKELEGKGDKESIKSTNKLIDDFKKEIDELKKRILQQKGGGSMPRQWSNSGTVFGGKYADFNLIPGTNISITTADNNTTKKTDITINAGDDDTGYLKLDQTTPQQVINGKPDFVVGIDTVNGYALTAIGENPNSNTFTLSNPNVLQNTVSGNYTQNIITGYFETINATQYTVVNPPVDPGTVSGNYEDATTLNTQTYYDDNAGHLISNYDFHTIADINYTTGFIDSTPYSSEIIDNINYNNTVSTTETFNDNGSGQLISNYDSHTVANIDYPSGNVDSTPYSSETILTVNYQYINSQGTTIDLNGVRTGAYDTATGFKTPYGISTQFLKADGSVDPTTYYKSGDAVSFSSITDTGLSQNSVVFVGSGGTLSQDNTNFTWDNTNKRLNLNYSQLVNTFQKMTLTEKVSSANGKLLTGTVYFATNGNADSGILTGINTLFTMELKVGDMLVQPTSATSPQFGGNAGTYYVKHITSNTQLEFYGGTSGHYGLVGSGNATQARAYRAIQSIADTSGNLAFMISNIGQFWGGGAQNPPAGGGTTPNTNALNWGGWIRSYDAAGDEAFGFSGYSWQSTGSWETFHTDHGSASMFIADPSANSSSNTMRVTVGTRDTTSLFNVGSVKTDLVVMQIKGIASQTADLTQWKNSSGTTIASINSTGQMNFFGNGLGYFLFNQGTTTSGNYDVLRVVPLSGTYQIQSLAGGTGTLASVDVNAGGYGRVYCKAGAFSVGINNNAPTAGLDQISQDINTIGYKLKAASGQVSDLAQWTDSSNNILAKILANGYLGLNSATVSSRLTVGDAFGDITTNPITQQLNTTWTPTADDSTHSVTSFAAGATKSGAFNITSSIGIRGFQIQAANSGAGNVTGMAAILAFNSNNSTGTVASSYGFYVFSPNASASHPITTQYGLYINDQAPTGVTNGYGVYQLGATTKNYFAGTMQIGGSLTLPYNPQTANYTITASDYTIDCTANTFTVTLPTASGITGRIYEIKNSGTGTITVNTTFSQTIDGSLTQTLLAPNSITVQSTGSNWIVI